MKKLTASKFNAKVARLAAKHAKVAHHLANGNFEKAERFMHEADSLHMDLLSEVITRRDQAEAEASE